MEDDTTLPTAALRDFSPVYVRFGSLATSRYASSGRAMSASLQKRTNEYLPRYVRLVPIVLQKSPRRHCGIQIWNNRIGDARAFESMLRVRVKTWINVTRSDGQNTFATVSAISGLMHRSKPGARLQRLNGAPSSRRSGSRSI